MNYYSLIIREILDMGHYSYIFNYFLNANVLRCKGCVYYSISELESSAFNIL